MKSVGEIITDGLTDGSRPSVYQSLVTPISVTKSVANKKNPPTEHRQSYRRIRARKKKVSRRNITDGINPSAISTVIIDGISVGNYGRACNCLPTLCEIPTDSSRRYIHLYVITDEIYPSVIMVWLVIVWQLSVKYRRILSVGMYLKYIKIIIY
jgi:hypothetical protein